MMGGLGGAKLLTPGGQEANIKRAAWVSQHSLYRHDPSNLAQLNSQRIPVFRIPLWITIREHMTFDRYLKILPITIQPCDIEM